MAEKNEFHLKSYDLHRSSYALHDRTLCESWFREDTVDAWRIDRMFLPFIPFLKTCSGTRWITIGDGRYGLDSIKLKKIDPTFDLLPTDIAETLLKDALERKLIASYKIENAEALSFPENSFDYAFCKESYHHFPRPAIALYEMLRVAKKGVLLIEPNDHIPDSILGKRSWKVKKMIKRILGKKILHPDHYRFEEAGNYVYALSKRELEKTALGLGLPVIAVKYMNDHYLKGVENEKADASSPLLKKLKREIARLDRRTAKGLENPGLILSIIFKVAPDKLQLEALTKGGFEIINLPSNPHFKDKT